MSPKKRIQMQIRMVEMDNDEKIIKGFNGEWVDAKEAEEAYRKIETAFVKRWYEENKYTLEIDEELLQEL